MRQHHHYRRRHHAWLVPLIALVALMAWGAVYINTAVGNEWRTPIEAQP